MTIRDKSLYSKLLPFKDNVLTFFPNFYKNFLIVFKLVVASKVRVQDFHVEYRYPQTQKSDEFRSGDLARQTLGPPFRIHWSL